MIIELDIDPVPKGRPRFSARGRFVKVYTPQKTKDFEKSIKQLVSDKIGVDQIDTFLSSIEVNVSFFIKRPKSVKRKYHTVKPDIDNLCKSLIDACNGILWKDDCQIVKLIAQKQYAEKGMIVIDFKGVKDE